MSEPREFWIFKQRESMNHIRYVAEDINPNHPDAIHVREVVISKGKDLQSKLDEEYRLNALGQERELRLMARIKELEKELLK